MVFVWTYRFPFSGLGPRYHQVPAEKLRVSRAMAAMGSWSLEVVNHGILSAVHQELSSIPHLEKPPLEEGRSHQERDGKGADVWWWKEKQPIGFVILGLMVFVSLVFGCFFLMVFPFSIKSIELRKMLWLHAHEAPGTKTWALAVQGGSHDGSALSH